MMNLFSAQNYINHAKIMLKHKYHSKKTHLLGLNLHSLISQNWTPGGSTIVAVKLDYSKLNGEYTLDLFT